MGEAMTDDTERVASERTSAGDTTAGDRSGSVRADGGRRDDAESFEVAMLIPGQIDDGGFMEAGYDGLVTIREELGADVTYVDGVEPEMDDQTAALRELAATDPDLLIAHGGQNSEAVLAVASEYPDVSFAVSQGEVTGENVASYAVLQEESAWLAGAASGLLTETDVVGHMSGIRVPPGLKGRAAFADGVEHTNPDAELLTTFAGDQDDPDLVRRVAEAQIESGVDHIFTMLNAGRTGVTEAVRSHENVAHFGNVGECDPDDFAGSAIADVGVPAVRAARDYKRGAWEPNRVVEIGLENEDAVRLSLSPQIPDDVRERIETLSAEIVEGEIDVATTYDGPEFEPEGMTINE